MRQETRGGCSACNGQPHPVGSWGVDKSGYEGRSSHTIAGYLLWPVHALEALLDNAAPLECILGLMECYSE